MSSTHDTLTHAGPEDSRELDGNAVSSELLASACLVGASGNVHGAVFVLLGTETVLGRAHSASVVIDDKALSSRHAKIVWNGSGHTLMDLDSTNGTFLNGTRLTSNEAVPISFGDSIQLANTVFTYMPNPRHDQTQALAPIVPHRPPPAGGGVLNTSVMNSPDAQMLMRLLQDANVQEAEPRGATFDEQIDKALHYWSIVRRHGILLLSCMALLAALGNVTVFLNPPRSEATFKMRVSPKTSDDPLERQYDRGDPEHREFYAAVSQNFLSSTLVESTLQSLGDKKPAKPRVMAVLGALKLDSIALSIYQGSYTDKDPSFAVRFLQAHVNNFLSSEIQRSLHVHQSEVGFLQDRLKETEDELRKTEQAQKDFKAKHIDGLPEYADQHFTSHEALLTRRTEVSAQLQRAQLELALARKRVKEEAPVAIQRAERARPFETAIVDVKRKISDARVRGLLDTAPELVNLNNNLKELERQAQQAASTDASAFDRSANPALIAQRDRVGELEVAVKSAGAELGEINAALARLNSIMGELPKVEQEYAELTRSYAASQDLHKKLFEKLRSSQLQLELERTSAAARYEILSPPESTGMPLRKALLLRTGLGAAVGLVLGILLAVSREFARYLRERKVRRTAIQPVAGTQSLATRR